MNRQDAVDDRDLDRWVQEVTDDWRQPALRVGQPSWQHRVVQPSGRSFHGLTTARRAAVGLAGVALVGIVAVALLLSSQILVPGGQPNGVGAVAATDLAATDGPTKTAAPSAAGPTEPTTTEPPPTDPSATDAPAAGIARDPLFHLTIESDRARYAADEPIAVAATLRYVGSDDRTRVTSSGGGLVAFAIEQLDGPIDMAPARTADCANYLYTRGDVEELPFQKSGGFSDEDPLADFWRDFFEDPELRLPAGEYRISAQGIYGPPECGTEHTLEASIVIVVE